MYTLHLPEQCFRIPTEGGCRKPISDSKSLTASYISFAVMSDTSKTTFKRVNRYYVKFTNGCQYKLKAKFQKSS